MNSKFVVFVCCLFGPMAIAGPVLDTEPRPISAQLSVAVTRHIVWQGDPHGYALFVPQELLGSETRDALPWHDEQRFGFEDGLFAASENQKVAWNDGVDCIVSSYQTASPYPTDESLDLVDLLLTQALVVSGSVIEVLPGWGSGGVMNLVYLRVEEVLHCQDGPGQRLVSAGDLVAVGIRKGQVQVDGVTLCDQTDALLEIPKKGTQVLVSGFPFANDAYYVGRGLVLPVVDDQIHPQPYQMLREREARPLDWVRGFLNGEMSNCGGGVR